MQALIDTLWAPWLVGLAGSVALEACLRPRPRSLTRRGVGAACVHLGSWCLLFALFTLVLQRPWFAVVFVLSLTLVVVQSSNTKSRTLEEPFICHDFEYFWDAIRHPRLYVPFFGIGLAIAASTAGAVAIGMFLYLEPALTGRHGLFAVVVTLALLGTLGAMLVGLGLGRCAPITLHPATDMHQLGLFASLWTYGIALYRSKAPASTPFERVTARAASDTSPNVVLIQSESFFDPRPWCDDIAPHLLTRFDATRTQALDKGTLTVPAWGANTVRTECAVLTGLAPKAWGARQFNPYHTLARRGLPSLASAFKAQGYRTVCVHPYIASFYKRDRVFPELGFESFIDMSDFDANDKHGQYIGDLAVARKVGRLLEDDDNRPLFIFVISMENHGPLHLEAPDRAHASRALPTAPWPLSKPFRDLAVYLKHLGEADEMIDRVKTSLSAARRPGLLGFYGDHVPILPDAYAHIGAPAGETPYMIWSTERTVLENTMPKARQAHELGIALFERASGHDMSSERIKADPEPQEQE
ncbi:LTA synthase family protein [Vreelandella malpeensis]|uniref:Sulfatase-like hydrolase/transferase n=1 Tax=Vreelandella malpeensis TaxID=1172368 RepID=A0ABS8DTB7_9GAMM|nr:LTA synthase family protein [Halomonas malpeensis]MCB8889563.1 sulfatase-like hydrolase/transferase [Halomonas malpeensis]